MNWIHLDLKGMMPGLPGMIRWVDWLAEAGFDGMVFEYEDRLPWDVFPGLHRPVLTLADWQQLWEHCRRRGLTVTPLIQTQGHLEWILKHPQYAHLREEGHWNELCPSHPESSPLLKAWLDEVLAFHPESEYVHLGADETWNLAACPRCRERAEKSGMGRMGVFLEHVGGLCRHLIERGKRPMIWADMFWRTDTWSTGSLPPETILVDWQYGGSGPWPSLARLRNTDHDVWGASAIRSGFDAKYALAPLGMRLENVLGWNRLRARGEVSHIMHTVWGRGDSLRPIYGPWEGWLPGFLAGAEAMAWSRHPLATLCTDVDRAMIDPEWIDPQPLMERLQSFQSDDAMVRDCVSWWVLALRHRRILQGAVEVVIGHAGYEAVTPRRGVDPQRTADRKAARERWRAATAEWRLEAAGWLAEHLYSETEEYLAVKLDGIERCLE